MIYPIPPVETRGFSALVFDVDGTLVDTIDLIVNSFNHAFEQLTGKRKEREEIISLFGPTEENLLRRLFPSRSEEAIALFHSFYRSRHRELVRVFPRIPELLRTLREKGIPLGALTNKGRRSTAVTLEETGLSSFFRVVVTGDDAPAPKPDPRGLLSALERLGAGPGESAFIGDAPVDLECARRAGVTAYLVAWGRVYPEETLARLRPDRLFRTPDECLAHLLPGEQNQFPPRLKK